MESVTAQVCPGVCSQVPLEEGKRDFTSEMSGDEVYLSKVLPFASDVLNRADWRNTSDNAPYDFGNLTEANPRWLVRWVQVGALTWGRTQGWIEKNGVIVSVAGDGNYYRADEKGIYYVLYQKNDTDPKKAYVLTKL
jgi:hypothetical protein